MVDFGVNLMSYKKCPIVVEYLKHCLRPQHRPARLYDLRLLVVVGGREVWKSREASKRILEVLEDGQLLDLLRGEAETWNLRDCSSLGLLLLEESRQCEGVEGGVDLTEAGLYLRLCLLLLLVHCVSRVELGPDELQVVVESRRRWDSDLLGTLGEEVVLVGELELAWGKENQLRMC